MEIGVVSIVIGHIAVAVIVTLLLLLAFTGFNVVIFIIIRLILFVVVPIADIALHIFLLYSTLPESIVTWEDITKYGKSSVRYSRSTDNK